MKVINRKCTHNVRGVILDLMRSDGLKEAAAIQYLEEKTGWPAYRIRRMYNESALHISEADATIISNILKIEVAEVMYRKQPVKERRIKAA